MAGDIAKRPNGKWRARYRDDAGKEHASHFDRKIDAQRRIDEQTPAWLPAPTSHPGMPADGRAVV